MQRTFVNNFVFLAEALIEEAPGIRKGEIRRHSRDTIDHTEPGGNHGSCEHNCSKSRAVVSDEVKSNAGKDHKGNRNDAGHWPEGLPGCGGHILPNRPR